MKLSGNVALKMNNAHLSAKKAVRKGVECKKKKKTVKNNPEKQLIPALILLFRSITLWFTSLLILRLSHQGKKVEPLEIRA